MLQTNLVLFTNDTFQEFFSFAVISGNSANFEFNYTTAFSYFESSSLLHAGYEDDATEGRVRFSRD